ncbi:uncharacterized protein, partial [Penaeus vannamei]|uniref:uncharacterized protein n=1 Tax=Penaeus vannamei TaxID=6689 RepID=UPI00387F4867
YVTSRSTDNVCSLYRARVSQRWPGYASASEANTFASCYSSWAYRDISHLTTVTATSYYGSRLPSHAVDGYSCDYESSYCTSVYGRKTLRIELPEPLAIRVVRVQALSSSKLPDVFFGNSSVYSENPKIATRDETTPDDYSVITVTPPGNTKGRYFFFRTNSNYLHICETAIVPF